MNRKILSLSILAVGIVGLFSYSAPLALAGGYDSVNQSFTSSQLAFLGFDWSPPWTDNLPPAPEPPAPAPEPRWDPPVRDNPPPLPTPAPEPPAPAPPPAPYSEPQPEPYFELIGWDSAPVYGAPVAGRPGGAECPQDPHCLSYGAITSVAPNQFAIGTVSEVTAFYKYGSLNSCGNIVFKMQIDTFLDGKIISTKLYPEMRSGQYVDSEPISVIGLGVGLHRVDMVFTDLNTNLTQTNHKYFLITAGPEGSPVGYHSDSSCSLTTGWACDADNYNQSLTVNLYDGPGFSKPLGSVTANEVRGSQVADQCGGIREHGFSFPTPNSVKDGLPHSIYAYATNLGLGSDILLSQSPKNIMCGDESSLFDYRISAVSPSIHAVKTSGDAVTQNTITKTLISENTEPVTLSVTGYPSGVTIDSILSQGCAPDCQSTIRFRVSQSTVNGTYPITVTGLPLNRQTNFDLVVSGNSFAVICTASPRTALINETVTWTATVTGGVSPKTYSWSGTNIPTSPAPTTNPYSRSYNTIGQKTTTVTVTDANSLQATCPTATVQINFDPSLKEF